jgi:hypothetical protein
LKDESLESQVSNKNYEKVSYILDEELEEKEVQKHLPNSTKHIENSPFNDISRDIKFKSENIYDEEIDEQNIQID